ncbi:MAG TPA: type 1 glutamine amidotransferase domain-containing protein [Candidatus Acidoferrales bacterium]|nr:type 1 glutamine amidotransferase domain-containing protein [Candidatus Acidoferrales bacterium]
MRIACVLENLFEDSEFKQPYEALKEAGHEVVIVGLEAGKELKGSKGNVSATTEKGIADVKPSDFDGLLIPGGYSPDKLRANDEMVEFVKAFMEAGKPVLAICHGPQLLITAGVTRGRRMTAWKTVQGDLRYTGAQVVDQDVIVDRNLVTSRMPADIPAFIRESLHVVEKAPALKR